MGELARFYGLATVAFVGGSLVPKGGHDILQPLFHGVPTLFGPHMHNQRALAELALSVGAVCQVANAQELGQVVATFLTGSAEGMKLRQAAARLLSENRGASARCAAEVASLVEEAGGNSTRRHGGTESQEGSGANEGRESAEVRWLHGGRQES